MFIYPSSKNPVFQEFGLSAISGKKNSWVLNSRKHLFMFLFTFFKKIEILKPCPIWFWKKLVYGFSCRKIFIIPTLNSTGDDNCSCIGQRIGKLIFLLQILEENMEAFFCFPQAGWFISQFPHNFPWFLSISSYATLWFKGTTVQ